MKKSFLFLALVLIFTQCQVSPIIQTALNPQELSNVCDSIISNKYFPAQYYNVQGQCIIDYNSVVIDSSDNDSVFVYVNISAQIDMDQNKIAYANSGSTYPLDTPTHVCLAGGHCYFLDAWNPQLSHVAIFSSKECSVLKMQWSSVSGLMKSSNHITMLAFARPKVSNGYLNPAMKPDFNLRNIVDILMYNRDWWIIIINNKKQRYNGGYFWQYM